MIAAQMLRSGGLRSWASLVPKCGQRLSHSGAANHSPKKTPFYDFHIAHKAKLVDFCGYSLPIQYASQGILESHIHVREHCGIFDVSHMLQTKVYGDDRFNFMESLTVADLLGLKPGSGTLSVYTNPSGGIMDDLIIHVCKEPYLYIVSNACCADKIKAHLTTAIKTPSQAGKDVKIEFMDHALLAVQGPKAYSVIKDGITDSDMSKFEDLYFMETMLISSFFGLSEESREIRITRCGYTGEDGYEISIPASLALQIGDKLCNNKEVRPIGLAARDTLRLEGGMCLYGNDLEENITPVEASLTWLIGKRRRNEACIPHFPGYSRIKEQLGKKSIVRQKRIGLKGLEGPVPRHGMPIFCGDDTKQVGEVTSGCFSPMLKCNIAMAYVKPDFCANGTELSIEVRKKRYPFTVSALPFVPNHYVRRP